MVQNEYAKPFTPEEAYRSTEDRAVFSSGTPFVPTVACGRKEFRFAQGDNVYIFCGVGLGAIGCWSRHVTR